MIAIDGEPIRANGEGRVIAQRPTAKRGTNGIAAVALEVAAEEEPSVQVGHLLVADHRQAVDADGDRGIGRPGIPPRVQKKPKQAAQIT